MSKKVRQEKKLQERKAKAKSRVLARRKNIREKAKKIDEEMKWQQHFTQRVLPIRNDSKREPALTHQTPVDDPRQIAWVKRKLEHNMDILKALEAEIAKEEAERESLQNDLKDQGALTLKEQIDLLSKTVQNFALEQQSDDAAFLNNVY